MLPLYSDLIFLFLSYNNWLSVRFLLPTETLQPSQIPVVVCSALIDPRRLSENSLNCVVVDPNGRLFAQRFPENSVVKTLTLNSTLHFGYRSFLRLSKVKGLRDTLATFPGSFSIYIKTLPQQLLQFMCMWSCELKYNFYLHISKEAWWVCWLHWQ